MMTASNGGLGMAKTVSTMRHVTPVNSRRASMIRRQLSDDLVNALVNSPFWRNIIADRELHPEIRGDRVTVYYSGCALMRELNSQHGQLRCSVNLQHVPFYRDDFREATLICSNEHGLEFEARPEPIPLGLGDPGVIAAYKAAVRVRPEQRLLGAVLNNQNNAGIVVDQEIAFPGNNSRIDLCYFDSNLKKLAFVEIKGVADRRLLSCGGNAPEVLTQLQNYAEQFAAGSDCILKAFQETIALKRKLGLGARVGNIQEGEPSQLLMKPILAIGGCNAETVQSIMNGDARWKPLMDGLPTVAARLYLFGNAGFALGGAGNHMQAWDN